MSQESVDALATARHGVQKAFNEGDFQRAFADLWETRSDGLVIRVRKYERREDALEGAGLQE